MSPIPTLNFQAFYAAFDEPVTAVDCGEKCAPHNPSQKPFCCDICWAVPSIYTQEWAYLQPRTDLWHIWRGDECAQQPEDPAALQADTPDSMLLMACRGPAHCERQFRSLSCRQFPFFPYITADYGFLGLAYNWEFEAQCWVINHLEQVSEKFRENFVQVYDDFFSRWPHELDHYAARSEQMRADFITQNRSIPLLHREGGFYLLRPLNERLRPVDAQRLPKYGPYSA